MVCLGMNGTVRIKTFVSKLFYCRCNCKYIFKQGFRCISKTSKQLPLYRTYTGMNGNARSVSSKAGKIVICEERESWEMLVSTEKLTVLEKKIHECHRNAVKKRELMYTDPQTGYQVMTRLAHLERGDCCGNSCRHPIGICARTNTNEAVGRQAILVSVCTDAHTNKGWAIVRTQIHKWAT